MANNCKGISAILFCYFHLLIPISVLPHGGVLQFSCCVCYAYHPCDKTRLMLIHYLDLHCVYLVCVANLDVAFHIFNACFDVIFFTSFPLF